MDVRFGQTGTHLRLQLKSALRQKQPFDGRFLIFLGRGLGHGGWGVICETVE
jgi:hypothetical protein